MSKPEKKYYTRVLQVSKPAVVMKTKRNIYTVVRQKTWWIITENVLAGIAWNG